MNGIERPYRRIGRSVGRSLARSLASGCRAVSLATGTARRIRNEPRPTLLELNTASAAAQVDQVDCYSSPDRLSIASRSSRYQRRFLLVCKTSSRPHSCQTRANNSSLPIGRFHSKYQIYQCCSERRVFFFSVKEITQQTVLVGS